MFGVGESGEDSRLRLVEEVGVTSDAKGWNVFPALFMIGVTISFLKVELLDIAVGVTFPMVGRLGVIDNDTPTLRAGIAADFTGSVAGNTTTKRNDKKVRTRGSAYLPPSLVLTGCEALVVREQGI